MHQTMYTRGTAMPGYRAPYGAIVSPTTSPWRGWRGLGQGAWDTAQPYVNDYGIPLARGGAIGFFFGAPATGAVLDLGASIAVKSLLYDYVPAGLTPDDPASFATRRWMTVGLGVGLVALGVWGLRGKM